MYPLHFRLLVSDTSDRLVPASTRRGCSGPCAPGRQRLSHRAARGPRPARRLPLSSAREHTRQRGWRRGAGRLDHRGAARRLHRGGERSGAGRRGAGLVWTAAGDTVLLNPLGRFPQGKRAELYYEVYGMARGAAMHTVVRLEKEGGRSFFGAIKGLFGRAARTRGARVRRAPADGPITRVHRGLDLRDAPRGRYLLSLTVTAVRASSRARNASKSRRASRFDTAPPATRKFPLPPGRLMYCSRSRHPEHRYRQICRSCGLDLTATTPISAIRAEPWKMTEIDMVRDQLKEEYDILDELGRGGMAIVFKPRERQLEREVAIKVLAVLARVRQGIRERSSARRARRQARAPQHHSDLTASASRAASSTFVMKFLRGKPLSAILAGRGAMPPGEIRVVLSQVGRALGYAHKSGIVHRDIKPDTSCSTSTARPWSPTSASPRRHRGQSFTGTGMSIGTPHYMSRSRRAPKALDGRSDLYSLASWAYQCLTGAVPLDGEALVSIG